jgi:hypothetical protein
MLETSNMRGSGAPEGAVHEPPPFSGRADDAGALAFQRSTQISLRNLRKLDCDGVLMRCPQTVIPINPGPRFAHGIGAAHLSKLLAPRS